MSIAKKINEGSLNEICKRYEILKMNLYQIKIYEKYSHRYSLLTVIAESKPKARELVDKAYDGKKLVFKEIHKLILINH